MRLTKLRIENFRGIRFLEVEFERDITVFIGENNSGKTSILEALELCLDSIKTGKSQNFSEYDFFMDETCQNLSLCKQIVLTLSFIESEEHMWPDYITQALGEVIVGDDYSAIKLRVTANYDPDTDEIKQSLCFLDDADNELIQKSKFMKDLRQLRPFFLQTALRAAKDQFHSNSTYWASFLRNKDIDEETRKALEAELYHVNRKIIDAHISFKDVINELGYISELMEIGNTDAVTVDPAQTNIYKSLRYAANVNLLTATNAKIPIHSHGEGTQSLSVLLLFSAYMKTRLQADRDKYAEPIIAIEEPEAHLHPNAARSVWWLLQELPGQKIVATHSGDILSEVPVKKIRRMRRNGSVIECRNIPYNILDAEETRKFNYHVRRNRGELLFAQCWLLVEGETDVSVFAECADILRINLSRYGIRIVEYSQAGGPALFIKAANALGICWHLIVDDDDAGRDYAKKAVKLYQEAESLPITIIPAANMDVLLCLCGYGDPYLKGLSKPTVYADASWEDVLEEMQRTFPGKPGQALSVAKKCEDRSISEITEKPTTREEWEKIYKFLNNKRGFSKPAAAMESIQLMREKGKEGVPDILTKVLNKITEAEVGSQ